MDIPKHLTTSGKLMLVWIKCEALYRNVGVSIIFYPLKPRTQPCSDTRNIIVGGWTNWMLPFIINITASFWALAGSNTEYSPSINVYSHCVSIRIDSLRFIFSTKYYNYISDTRTQDPPLTQCAHRNADLICSSDLLI